MGGIDGLGALLGAERRQRAVVVRSGSVGIGMGIGRLLVRLHLFLLFSDPQVQARNLHPERFVFRPAATC